MEINLNKNTNFAANTMFLKLIKIWLSKLIWTDFLRYLFKVLKLVKAHALWQLRVKIDVLFG